MATFTCRVQFLDDRDPFASTSFPEPARPPVYSFLDNVPLINQIASIHRLLQAPHKLEDCALQIYRYHSGTQGDFGVYLDLESTIDELAEELEGFTDQRKNAIILRTQLSVRVHTISERLLMSTGRELRRALFSLKQIFQDDKDLVHEFVNNDGLNCLITVGTIADQNYQNYILRALGQVMLYVDGMEGVIQHNPTIQWLYSLLASKGRLVVKTALKLLLVFVEYTESNTLQLMHAIDVTDSRRGLHPWTNIMSLLNEKDGADTELLIYTMTLINKVISAIPDQETFYDLTDALEELGMEIVTQRHMNKQGADLDLLTQFQLYESALKHEDGEDFSVISQVENLRQVPRKKSESHIRKSKRHEGGHELTLAEPYSSQPPEPEVLQETSRRRRQDRRDLPTGLPSSLADKNELEGQGTSHLLPEKSSPNNQHKINSRLHRRDRQRSFIDEKHELQSMIESQNKQQESSVQGFPTPFSQAERPLKMELQTESLLLDLQQPSPTVHTNVSSSQVRLSSGRNSDGAFFFPNNSLKLCLSSEKSQTAVTHSSPDSYSERFHQPVLSPTSRLRMPDFSHKLKISDSTPSVSYLPDPDLVDSRRSDSSINHPANYLNTQSIDNMSGHMSGNTVNNMHHQQPHHPHFLNHYHQYNSDHSTKGDHHKEILNTEKSYNYKNVMKEPPADVSRKSGFDHFSEPPLSTQHSIETTQNLMTDNQKDFSAANTNQKQMLYRQTSETEGLTKMENGFMFTGESQVKNMLNRLKNEEAEAPRRGLKPVGDVSGIISAARENLNQQNSQQQFFVQSVGREPEKKGESDFQWDRIQRKLNRQLIIKDMDFSDLKDEDDHDIFSSSMFLGHGSSPNVVPPPPPPLSGDIPPPPPLQSLPPPPPQSLPPSHSHGGYYRSSTSLPSPPGADLKKNKKTVRLHWRAVPGDSPHPATKGEVIWKHLVPVKIDTNKLEHLFETKTAEVKTKDLKQDGASKKEITVLDPKRSNAINIGLTVLPPPRSIKAAILKMDNSIMNKEGVEKILTTMIPSEEEKAKILEAQMANPDIPLGTAEQFLLILSSIFELEARLKLWLFKLEYELSEQELAEPLMDLKKGIAELQRNKTLRCILSGVLTIGNFLNGAAVHAFNIEFLQRLPEIKDTVRKQSLIHHLCSLIIEQFPDTTDLYSEIGPITRCSRVDWDELANKLKKMENDCKASWDHLQAIIKHDGSSSDLKGKMSSFLADAAERIMILNVIYKRVLNRYNKLLLFLGLPVNDAREMKVNHFCKVISEFALEYRTTRDKVIQMLQKKANQRERKKTRGKMIVDMDNFKNKNSANDDALHNILKNNYVNAEDSVLPGHRSRRKLESRSMGSRGGLATDSDLYDTAEDEILEACVRTAAAPSARPQRVRQRSRHQRKSLRRTLKGGLAVEELQVIEAFNDQM